MSFAVSVALPQFIRRLFSFGPTIWPLFIFLIVMQLGCAHAGKQIGRVCGGAFVLSQLQKEEFPKKFDSTRTYYYYTNHVSPDSLLNAMRSSGFAISRAWYCEDVNYYCMDSFGPHFVVELEKDDPRILSYKFTRGEGRLQCSHQLNLYSPTD